jgi:hypothetical protein
LIQLRKSKNKAKYNKLKYPFYYLIIRPSDYFSGEILRNGKKVSNILGTYLGFIEFDEVRYWDIRDSVYLKTYDNPNQRKSSSLYREDRIYLEKGEISKGQEQKERLENLQRYDRKLREAQTKLRKKQSKN